MGFLLQMDFLKLLKKLLKHWSMERSKFIQF